VTYVGGWVGAPVYGWPGMVSEALFELPLKSVQVPTGAPLGSPVIASARNQAASTKGLADTSTELAPVPTESTADTT